MNRRWVPLAAVAVISASASQADVADFRGAYDEARRGGSFVPASPAELEEAARLFNGMFGRAVPPELAGAWAAIGFDLKRLEVRSRQFLLLAEHAGRKEGRGLYLFYPEASSRIVLELPHSFKDLKTGEMGFLLSLGGRFRAVAWNSVPRYYKKDGRRIDTDLAHIRESHFNAFTRAAARQVKDLTVVQLHGFEQGKRKPASHGADMIVSSGSRTPSRGAVRLVACLREATGLDVRLYGDDIRELGGTTNAQNEVLRSERSEGFLHLELSIKTRERAVSDGGFRDSFAGCLEKAVP